MTEVCVTDLFDTERGQGQTIPAGSPLPELNKRDYEYLQSEGLLMDQAEWDAKEKARLDALREQNAPEGTVPSTSALEQEAARLREVTARLEQRLADMDAEDAAATGDGESAAELESAYDRAGLEALAADVGVENPEALPNKMALAEAIVEARG